MDKETFKQIVTGNGERGVVATGEIPFADAYALMKEMKHNGEGIDFNSVSIRFTDFSARVPKMRAKGKTLAERIADGISCHCDVDSARASLKKPMYDTYRDVAFATDGRSMVMVRPNGEMFGGKSRAECGYQEEALQPNWTVVVPDFDCESTRQAAFTIGYVTNGDDFHNQIGAIAKIAKAIAHRNDYDNDINLLVWSDAVGGAKRDRLVYNPEFFRDCLDSLFRLGCTRVQIALASTYHGAPDPYKPIRFFGDGGEFHCEAVLMPLRLWGYGIPEGEKHVMVVPLPRAAGKSAAA